MDLFISLVLGLVQGVTEFFPVSSSGHLALFPFIFNFKDPGLAFDIGLHAGTFFAILIALKSEWISITRSVLSFKVDKYTKIFCYILLTAIPGAILGVLLEEKAETVFRNPLLIAGAMIVFGIILVLVDHLVKKAEKIEKMTASKALLIGLSQGLALLPGVSRSGATITAGRALGFSREAAVRYSFMAALPIIVGATVYGLRDVALSTLLSGNWVAGFIASFIASFWAIKFLTGYVRKKNFNIFLYWRIVVALLVVVLYFVRS